MKEKSEKIAKEKVRKKLKVKRYGDVLPEKMDKRYVVIMYIIFQILIIATMIWAIVRACTSENNEKSIEHILVCVMALIIYHVPMFIKRKWNIYIPSVLQAIAIVFIFAHFIVGEIFRLYDYSVYFDKILHTTSGLAFSALGFSLINLFNTDKGTMMKLSPFFVALFSFCFSMMIAGLWEIFEYTFDSLFGSNMQTWKLTAEELAELGLTAGRYGLLDTMGDIIVCAIGSFVISLLGYISLKTKNNFLNKLLLKRVDDFDVAIEEARTLGDEKLVAKLRKEKAKHYHVSEEEFVSCEQDVVENSVIVPTDSDLDNDKK